MIEAYTLSEACYMGSLPLVKKLYDKEVKKVFFNPDTIMELAIRTNHINIVRYLIIDKKLDVTNNASRMLTLAAELGRYDIAKYLIKRGAGVNYNEGWPIILACKNGHTKIVKLLVENGANITAKNNLAIKSAIRHGRSYIVEYLNRKADEQ